MNHELQMNTVLVNRKNSRIMAQEMKKQEERRTGQFILIGSTVIFIALSAGKVRINNLSFFPKFGRILSE